MFFFLIYLLQRKNFFARKCYRCNEFIFGDSHEKIHNFQEGRNLPAENKPLEKTTFDQKFVKYGINFDKHSDDYNFPDESGISRGF